MEEVKAHVCEPISTQKEKAQWTELESESFWALLALSNSFVRIVIFTVFSEEFTSNIEESIEPWRPKATLFQAAIPDFSV